MKQLGQDKSAELLQRPLDEECETNELVNKMTEDVVNSDPLMELQFASISLDPRGNIIIWNTNSLCPGNVRTAESFKLPRRKVADHREYFSVEGQQDAANALAELDPQ